MTASDSLPIQFWSINNQTNNEKVICGLIKQDCFCQPWLCSDSTFLQFTNSGEVSAKVYDSANNLLSTIAFYQSPVGVWNADIHFSLFGCKDVYFVIGDYENVFTNGEFNVSLSPWGQTSTGSNAWVWDAGTAKVNVYPNPEFLNQTFSVKPAGSYRYSISGRASLFLFGGPGTNDQITVTANFYKSGVFTEGHTIANNFISDNIDRTFSGSFTALFPFDKIELSLSFIFGAPGGSYDLIFKDVSISSFVEALKSDCQNLKTSQDCTELIAYSNSTNFDGIDYSDLSPGRVFYARFPAIFFEEKNPQEQEDIVKSDGTIVTLRSSIEQKRKFETGYMPNYMHLKLQKILMHETITINGQTWKKRDSYDDNPVRKYNMKMASVLLTLYNSVEKNTI